MDPISITGLSLQVVQILAPIVLALRKAYQDGKGVHETLHELLSDLNDVYELTDNIHRLFSAPSFIEAVRGVQRESNVNLVDSLERALESCSKGAQKLLDILVKLGLQTREGFIRRTHLQWRLDRRLEDIDRLKRNFQDHKSSIQLAFQLLTTCKQMQIAERDARHATDLKAQIGELQKAIEQISQQITIRQVAPSDEEQTQILDEMKDMHDTSRNLQRRATMRLEYLTSLTEDAGADPYAESHTRTPRLSVQERSSLSPTWENEEFDSSSMVNASSTSLQIRNSTPLGLMHPNTPDISSELARANSRSLQITSSESLISTSQSYEGAVTKSGEVALRDGATISAQDFENELSALLASAATQQMGSSKPFSEDLIAHLANMLNAVGKHAWSERPRTYLVLRLINEVRAMDNFIFEGFKDIDFPYTNATLPDCINVAGARHNFLHQQRYVLSPKSADLVRGGRHRHLDHSADAFFKIVGKIGSGGFSVVDKVRSRLTLQEYARKRIDRSGAFAKNRKALASFENEVHNLKRLSHHHLVEFVGSYTDRKYIGIIMQPVADIDLHRHLLRQDLSPEDLVLLRSFVGCLCSALAYLHQNKCRHKDLKPHNILIKGDMVLLADFGTAFDWTESESEITVGPPEAFTKLYIAPEVGRHEPRDTSSDIWSLGCVFIEIATVLAGLSLQKKSDFFGSFETASAAYWRNHDALGKWVKQLRSVSGDTDASLFTWIESMTALDSSSRPTAEDLINRVMMEQTKGIQYGRSCCFEDLHSDETSWEGSVAEDDVFETAQTVSDVTTMSSKSMSSPQPLINEPSSEKQSDRSNERMALQLQPSAAAVQPSVLQSRLSRIPVYRGSLQFSPASQNPEEWNKSWTLPKSHTPEPKVLESGSLLSQPGSTIEQAQTSQYSSSSRRNIPSPLELHPSAESPVVQGNAAVEENGTAAELKEAFLGGHQRLENFLMRLRGEEPTWRSHLSSLIWKPVLDSKGFNILLAASRFNNDALSSEIVEMVIRKKPALINDLTLYKNSALHNAAFKGRAKLVEFLIENGALPGLQNLRGATPLHLALMNYWFDAAIALIPHLSQEQINARDDRGRTPIHCACVSAPLEIIHRLIDAGAILNVEDCLGLTPIQTSKLKGNTHTTEVLKSQMLRDTPKFQMNPPAPYPELIQRFKGQEMTNCYCESCRLAIIVRGTGDKFPKNELCCSCPNHIRLFQEDSLSLSARGSCPCVGCVNGREYNAKNPPCGTPISYRYLPYNDSLTELLRVPAPFTEPPTLLSRADFADRPLPPYPGHRYYDRLIDEELSKSASKLSQQDATMIALNSLADAGFKGSKSYRKNPNKALKWVISHYKGLPHVGKIVEILLDCGADVDTASEYWSLLDHAADSQNIPLMKLLLDRKATVDVALGNTIRLRLAILGGQALSARMLLRAGADVNDEFSAAKRTLLHLAVLGYDKIGWFIPLLLAHGAWTETRDLKGNTPLHAAVSHKHIHAVVTLLESGADIEAINKDFARPLELAMDTRDHELTSTLLLYGANVHQSCGDMPCALFYAIRKGLSSIVRLLLEEYGGDRDIQEIDSYGQNVLHHVAFSSIKDASVVDLLFGFGINVDAETKKGSTALHQAAYSGNVVVAKKLLECGATMHLQNHDGMTPLDYAQMRRHREVVECLGGIFKKSWWRR